MKYIKAFFLTAFLLFSALYGFILMIDPYDKFGFNPLKMKTKAVAMARENKFNVFEHTKKNYEAFIIGSSAAHRINTSDIKRITGFETYNYALQHTSPDDYLAILNHILSRAKPKLILLQMDYTNLDKNFKTDTRFYISPLYKYLKGDVEKKKESTLFDADYLTLEAIRDSFKVLWVNWLDKARHIYVKDGNYEDEPTPPNPIKVNQFHGENYLIDEVRIGYLKEIKRLCDQNEIKLIVFTAPVSWAHYQRILNTPHVKLGMELYKKNIALIFGEVQDFMNDSVESFNTTEFFLDSSHPSRKFSNMMIEKILNNNDFGIENFGKKI